MIGRLLRKGLRAGWRWWWADVRPSAASDRRHDVHPPALDPEETGRAPRADERLVVAPVATGPWAGVDPARTPAWPGRAGTFAVGLWATAVVLRVRRQR